MVVPSNLYQFAIVTPESIRRQGNQLIAGIGTARAIQGANSPKLGLFVYVDVDSLSITPKLPKNSSDLDIGPIGPSVAMSARSFMIWK